jgi:serine/threonine protein kinase
MLRSQQAQGIYQGAIALAPEQRAEYIERACGGDEALRAQVVSLLMAGGDGGAPVEDATVDAGPVSGIEEIDVRSITSKLPAEVHETYGTKIGPYKVLELIGEGGFGSVYMAQQEHPVQRRVALKIIKLGMDTRQVVARFEQERQALAVMDHPNIAKVFDAGATVTGRPYFVMELVKGDPIVSYCDKHKLSIRERLELFVLVCRAVQHAHTKGIIHRDIKPSNILVTVVDGAARPKVIDFGIAKATNTRLTEMTLFTEQRQLIGTPEYMSPEQAHGSLDIDTRTDVYSLGVVLYELLTGSTPFSGQELRSAAYAEIQRIILEVDPPRPSTRLSQSGASLASVAAQRSTQPARLGIVVRGELDWIVMKALEKNRQRRYETAVGLALDVQRYLNGEAIVAAPASASYRLSKFVTRNKGVVLAGSAVAAALLLGVFAFAWQARDAREQRDIALDSKKAETMQRELADAQRDKAIAAQAEANKRAAEIKQIAAFQAKMLQDIDARSAGEKLMLDVRERFTSALVKAGTPPADVTTRADLFAKELSEVNATDTAAALIDATLLKPARKAVDTEFADQPVVAASLRGTLGVLYRTLANYDEALVLHESALRANRAALGDDHPDTLDSISQYALSLERKGDEVAAEGLWREVMERRQRVQGNDNELTMQALGNLGNNLRSQSKFDEAEPLLRGAFEGHKRIKGPSDRKTLYTMNTLGFFYAETGKLAETELYWRGAYEIGLREFGPDDPDVLVWTNNLGGLLVSMGKYADAEPFCLAAAEGMRRAKGVEHPDTLTTEMGYANVLALQGKSAAAEPIALRVVETRIRVLGEEHPETVQGLLITSNILREQYKYEESGVYIQRAVDIRTRVLGPSAPDTLFSVSTLARSYCDRGDLGRGISLYREVLDRAEGVWPETAPNRLFAYQNLGSALTRAEKYAEARKYLQKCYDLRVKVAGPENAEALNVLTLLARVSEMEGDLETAERMYRELLQKMIAARGPESISTISARSNLGDTLRGMGKYPEALALAEQVAAAHAKAGERSGVLILTGRQQVGRILISMGRLEEARAQITPIYPALVEHRAGTVERKLHATKVLMELYAALEKAEPGKGHSETFDRWKREREVLEKIFNEKKAGI